MSLALTRENFFWHKLHSLTGIVPIGFYLVQHLTLNSFSLAGADRYNSVSGFFYSMPEHILWAIEILVIYLPLLFHAIYGLFITSRAKTNYFTTRYKWSQNRMYTLQRWSGVFLFFFIIWHVSQTTWQVKFHGTDTVNYEHMHNLFTIYGGTFLVLYAVGVLAASYHFCYGIWNFCIRWGITVSDRAQIAVQRFSFSLFLLVTAIGWLALLGFFVGHTSNGEPLTALLMP